MARNNRKLNTVGKPTLKGYAIGPGRDLDTHGETPSLNQCFLPLILLPMPFPIWVTLPALLSHFLFFLHIPQRSPDSTILSGYT